MVLRLLLVLSFAAIGLSQDPNQLYNYRSFQGTGCTGQVFAQGVTKSGVCININPNVSFVALIVGTSSSSVAYGQPNCQGAPIVVAPGTLGVCADVSALGFSGIISLGGGGAGGKKKKKSGKEGSQIKIDTNVYKFQEWTGPGCQGTPIQTGTASNGACIITPGVTISSVLLVNGNSVTGLTYNTANCLGTPIDISIGNLGECAATGVNLSGVVERVQSGGGKKKGKSSKAQATTAGKKKKAKATSPPPKSAGKKKKGAGKEKKAKGIGKGKGKKTNQNKKAGK